MKAKTYKIVMTVLIVWFTLTLAATIVLNDEKILLWGTIIAAVGWLAFAILAIYKTITTKDDIV